MVESPTVESPVADSPVADSPVVEICIVICFLDAQMITPLSPYLFLSLALLRRYEPEAELGTPMSRLAVDLVPFLVTWPAVLGVSYALDLPLGPGAEVLLP
ncbi:hypothetical protein GCM10010145_52580 [Streptomyces ruber]|uniref:Uncharacterized protein n=2 Tax=Streptomyces TaxID=1883 RepID=A0A918BKT9_9ACTN|nr:hypothetical protein GCM10010145_52580 [Streptomyces ruber]